MFDCLTTNLYDLMGLFSESLTGSKYGTSNSFDGLMSLARIFSPALAENQGLIFPECYLL